MLGEKSDQDCDYKKHHHKVEVVLVQIVCKENQQFFYKRTELVLVVRNHN